MPLERGGSRQTISHNIAEMEAAAHPDRQAVAASLREACETGGNDAMAEDKVLNFKSKEAESKWTAFGQMHGLFSKPGNQTVHISGQPHRVSHDEAPSPVTGRNTADILGRSGQ